MQKAGASAPALLEYVLIIPHKGTPNLGVYFRILHHGFQASVRIATRYRRVLEGRVALPSSSHDSGMLLSVSVAISERPKVLPINQNSGDVFYQRNDFQKAVK